MSATRLGWAALLILRPRVLLRVGGETDPGRAYLALARVLGVRQLGQSWLERGHSRQRTEVGAVVDGLHAASAFGFGLRSKRHRRLAYMDAAVATTFGLSGVWRAMHAPRRTRRLPVP